MSGAVTRNLRAVLDRTTLGWAAVLVFLAVSLPIALLGRGERSSWIHQTSPVEGFAANPLLGYSHLLGGEPIHKENAPSIDHVVIFCGAPSPLGMYSVRPVYAFTAALIQPFLGILGSLAAVNYLCWALAVWIGWRFARALFEDEIAGFVASVLVSCGSGMAFHIADYSAHLMSFMTYYLGICYVHESGVWREERPLRTHLALGVFLALACVQYNMGIALTIGYLLVSFRRNRWRNIAASAAIALSAQRIWHLALTVIDAKLNGESMPTNFYAVEQGYFERALATWVSAFRSGWRPFLGTIVEKGSGFVYLDSPPIVILGIVALVVLFTRRPRVGWLSLAFLGPPLGAGLLYSSEATARGYLIYGVSILFYAAIGGLFAEVWRHRGGLSRATATVVLGVALIVQVAWIGADIVGNFGPAKSYTFGHRPWVGSLVSSPLVVSMTGHEPTPRLFTGQATLVDAGAPPGPPRMMDVRPSIIAAVGTRAVFLAYGAALVMLLVDPTRRIRALRLFVAAMLVAALLSVITLRKKPISTDTDTTVRIPAGTRFTYDVDLSPELVEALATRASEKDAFELFASVHGPHELHIAVGGREIACERSTDLAVCRPAAVLEALRGSRRLTFRVEARADAGPEGVWTKGWQQAPRPGRRLAFEGTPPTTTFLPAFEVRLRDPNGMLKVGGF